MCNDDLITLQSQNMASIEFFIVLLHGEGNNCVFSGTYFPLKPVCTQFDVFSAYYTLHLDLCAWLL